MAIQKIKKQTTESVVDETNGKLPEREAKSYNPSEDEIRELAENIYHQRTDYGEHGTAEDDWLKAEDYLRNQQDF